MLSGSLMCSWERPIIVPFRLPQNPAWISVGSNPGLRCERPTTVRAMVRPYRTKRKTSVCSQFRCSPLFVAVIIMFSIIHLHVLGGVTESADNV